MTTPVNASAFSNVLKLHGNLRGKSAPSELPIFLIKSFSLLFFFLNTRNTEVEAFFFYTKKAIMPLYEFCRLFDSWVCLFPLQHLAGAPIVFFFPRLSLRCTCSHCALPNIKFHYKAALCVGPKVPVLLIRLNDVCLANCSAQFDHTFCKMSHLPHPSLFYSVFYAMLS